MIDYAKIAAAVHYYTEGGFAYIDAPWAVSKTAAGLTCPANATLYPLEDDFLIASGEQSFFQLIIDEKLAPGCYSCVTPCFRDDEIDRLHQRYFLKVELIDTKTTTISRVLAIAEKARVFFSGYLSGVSIVATRPKDPNLVVGSSFDVVSKTGIELGSYGMRQHPLIGNWVYATGCAEPRLSIAMLDEG